MGPGHPAMLRAQGAHGGAASQPANPCGRTRTPLTSHRTTQRNLSILLDDEQAGVGHLHRGNV